MVRSPHSLISTERRLVTLFVGGAFLFLVIFEGVFILGRVVLEGQFQKEDFEAQIEQVIHQRQRAIQQAENHAMTRILMLSKGRFSAQSFSGENNIGFLSSLDTPPETGDERGMKRALIGMNALIIDDSGKIIENRGEFDMTDINELIEYRALRELPPGITAIFNDTLLRKVELEPNRSIVFIRRAGYPLEDIIRDILRFLMMDIAILLPFYFMGRYFIREILEPVERNMDTMSHFIHDAGHELKTPLAIISGNLQILRDSKSRETDLIENSLSTISSMSSSLDGLLELVNLKKGTKNEQIFLNKSIDEILLASKKDIESKHLSVSTDIPKNLKIQIYPQHFQILFSNLLQNAIRYNKDYGSINVSYKDKSLRIQDSGIGMSEESTKKIFDRFFRVDRSGKYPGTGIGLSMVERIVRLYGWDIRIESQLGIGTTFFIKIK